MRGVPGGVRRALRIAMLVAALAAAPAHAFFHRVPDWPELKQSVRERHPHVPQLTTAQLRAWLADAARLQPLLLDARAPAEYAVSHLKDARLAPDLAAALRALQGRPTDVPVVVYCSVGERSSALAEQLICAGYRNVSNLEGSIFEWANLGYPLYRGAGPATKVHPYDSNWRRLLERKRWSEPGT
jgi:rhodanese-related sulfurtransferase